jgi:hypothetical protein
MNELMDALNGWGIMWKCPPHMDNFDQTMLQFYGLLFKLFADFVDSSPSPIFIRGHCPTILDGWGEKLSLIASEFQIEKKIFPICSTERQFASSNAIWPNYFSNKIIFLYFFVFICLGQFCGAFCPSCWMKMVKWGIV